MAVVNLKEMTTGWQKTTAAAVSIVSFMAAWHLVVQFTRLGLLLPGPVTVVVKFFKSFYIPIGKYTLPIHILFSLSRVMVGFALASCAGIFLGLSMGWNRSIKALIRPLFEIVRPIPPIAWISLAVLWFGLGETSKYFIIFISGFANITINVYTGAISVDPTLVGVAQMLGAKKSQLFTTVVIPSSIPYIFTGLQIAISSSWAAVVAAEMIRSNEGVGWLITSGMGINDTPQIMVGIMSIGIVGFLLATIMRKVEAVLCKWVRNE
jgi:NitT/TauT family transport system permease protein/sulfonate transport system permease protein